MLLVERLAILVASRRFLGMGDADSGHCVLKVMSASTYLRFLSTFFVGCAAKIHATYFACSSWYFGFAVLILAIVYQRAMLILWHDFMFLGLRPMGVFLFAPFCLVFFTAFLVKNFTIFCDGGSGIQEHQRRTNKGG
jgi:hypothetical protein